MDEKTEIIHSFSSKFAGKVFNIQLVPQNLYFISAYRTLKAYASRLEDDLVAEPLSWVLMLEPDEQYAWRTFDYLCYSGGPALLMP